MRSSEGSKATKTPSKEAANARFAIAVAEWNDAITEALLDGAQKRLLDAGAIEENLIVRRVPGAFELPFAAGRLIEEEEPDAVLTLGSLIRGETIHFDVIAHSVAQAIQELNIRSKVPVLFGILTDENMEQAQDRAGGSKGNKGEEAAEAAVNLLRSF